MVMWSLLSSLMNLVASVPNPPRVSKAIAAKSRFWGRGEYFLTFFCSARIAALHISPPVALKFDGDRVWVHVTSHISW